MTYYVLDENNNKHEALDKEGVLALLRQAIENGDLTNVDADSAFVSKFKCCVSGTTNYIAFTTQATYNALKAADQLTPNCYYFIIDDDSATDINNKLEEIDKNLTALISKNLAISTTVNKLTTNVDNLLIDKRQYIGHSNFSTDDLIYSSAVSTQNRVALTFTEGKTKDDTIGLSGRLYVSLDGSSYHYLEFDILWSEYDYLQGVINKNILIDNKLYWFKIYLGIDSSNKLYCSSTPKCYNITDNVTASVARVRPYLLNVFYK